ncbi:MAG: alpha-1,2-fucosyltransferase [Proteiniphilum sp.]|jgi:hypothetical protein|nr:alpha-1,2-fucosyltransferase [Proteiniphilum sp.]
MIIVLLKGGFGNQLFQYAIGKQLSVKYNMPLKLDLSFLEAEATGYTQRSFELDKLNISAGIATQEEVERIKRRNRGKLFNRTKIRERNYSPFKIRLKPGRDYYLNGYWQSDKYFKEIGEIIREEFTFKENPEDEYFIDMQEQITSSDSVSVHFRRGDYITNQPANKLFETCSPDYYRKAIDLIATRIGNPKLFIFSDDISWVRQHFKTIYPTVFVDKSDIFRHSDFRLMAKCKHHIIANSTYSWWAAWLNPDKEKIVIAPRKWFRSKQEQFKTKDKLPKEWIKI